VTARHIRFTGCQHWRMDDTSVRHESGRYFSVGFVNDGSREHLMIDQPEIGILGFVLSGQGADRRWLAQAKAEPGNVGYVQWAPTVQATRSNYERVHGGEPTLLLELFTGPGPLIENTLGSEQGDRFLNKFNRNCKVLAPDCFAPPGRRGHFEWISNRQLKAKLREDFTLNTDARSVIACGSWHLMADLPDRMFLDGGQDTEIAEALHRSYGDRCTKRQARALELLGEIAEAFPVQLHRTALRELVGHELSDAGVFDCRGLRVLGYFDCQLPGREVARWQQPLIEEAMVGQHVLLYSVRDGVAFFRTAAYPEIGFHRRAELGPSLQSGEARFRLEVEALTAMLNEAETLAEVQQSDEGGRFFRRISRYRVARWHGDPKALSPANGCWLSAGDLEELSRRSGVLSNELRTLLSLLLSAA